MKKFLEILTFNYYKIRIFDDCGYENYYDLFFNGNNFVDELFIAFREISLLMNREEEKNNIFNDCDYFKDKIFNF